MIDRTIKDFSCGENVNIAKTKAGLLRGYKQNEVFEFKGIRYAEAERFQSPKPVTPWEGVKEALDYGFLCPTKPETTMEGNLAFPKRYWFWDENCQYLNVWTKWLNDTTAKKPVVVWCHGGGFTSGSSIELECYDGENMCRYGDVVQVSLNHRLNIYGFLDVSDFGEQYKDSGNVGMLDIVEALKWVQENIAEFGGDPDNVTILGESGGGGKVRTLTQMAAADGLYHHVICDSGVMGPRAGMKVPTPEEEKEAAKASGRKFVEAAGGMENLLAMNNDQLLALMEKVNGGRGFMNWGPVPLTGTYIGEYYSAGYRKETLNIPMIVGSVFTELVPRPKNIKDRNTMTEEEKMAALVEVYGDHAEEVAEEFKKAYPEFNLFYASHIDNMVRTASRDFCEGRAKAGGKDTYNFLFAHESYYKGGMVSTHADELFFIFHNAEYFGSQYGGEATWKIQDEFFNSIMAFVKTGDPNNDGIPEWKRVEGDSHNTFVFSKNPGTRSNYDDKLMELVEKYAKHPNPFFRPKKEED